eukprot:m.117663 g.117663  ORF g.117663 m.117663 type:complete len:607 (-) comp28595_c0_seq1:36-1856(-)
MVKYILVSGGVISGVGKGIISSSLGALIRAQGLRVTSIKIDPYLNIDAGTFSPYEHGETYVLDDGGEVDLDLGNYERFVDLTLRRDNNITTGKIYQHVITNERRGDYLGKTVQVVPHITNAIIEWVFRVAKIPTDGTDQEPDICIIELGGTVGDIESMPFVEAFRQFQFKVGKDDFVQMHVSLVPETGSSDKEQKTKPTQHSIRELRGLGLSPHVIVCRSSSLLDEKVRQKISMFCHVAPDHVLGVHDVASIYRVPMLLESQGILTILSNLLNINVNPVAMSDDGEITGPLAEWRQLADRAENSSKTVKIILVGKYTALSDAYASVISALKHSCLHVGRGVKLELVYVEASDLEKATETSNPTKYFDAWTRLCSGEGILVPGGFGARGIEGKIAAINWARLRKVPYLGVCLGMQLAVIEFARNVLDWKDANTTEVDSDTPHPVIIEMPEISTTELGGTMRLGKRETRFMKPDCISKKLYKGADSIHERHRHRYEVNPKLTAKFEEKGLQFVGHDTEGERMEICELDDHPFFVAAQFHPEYLSRPMRPAPLFFGFVSAACGKLKAALNPDVESTSQANTPAPTPVSSPSKSSVNGVLSPDAPRTHTL